MKLRQPGLFMFLIGLLAACGQLSQTYTLEKDNNLSGNQHIAAVNVDLQEGSSVAGDLNVTASTAVINGHVDGDLTVVAADLTLGDHAEVAGDFLYCLVHDGQFVQSEGAVIWGTIENSCEEDAELTFSSNQSNISPLVWLLGLIFLPLGAGLAGSLSTILLPKQTNRISLMAHENRFKAVILGGFTLIVAAALTALYVFSTVLVFPLVLAPVVFISWTSLLAVTIFGGIALARPFGIWLLSLFRLNVSISIIPTMLGAAVLVFLLVLIHALSPAAWLSWLITSFIGAWGLGAVLLTYPVTGRNFLLRKAA